MKIYKHKIYFEKIELLGLKDGSEVVCRYLDEDMKDIFFSIPLAEFKKNYIKI